jgi:hypothetical protein
MGSRMAATITTAPAIGITTRITAAVRLWTTHAAGACLVLPWKRAATSRTPDRAETDLTLVDNWGAQAAVYNQAGEWQRTLGNLGTHCVYR